MKNMNNNDEYKEIAERIINAVLHFTTEQLKSMRFAGIEVLMREIDTFIKIYEQLISKNVYEIVHL